MPYPCNWFAKSISGSAFAGIAIEIAAATVDAAANAPVRTRSKNVIP